MALLDGNLLPATFRGAPFAVTDDSLGGGRRIALHQYPGRDDPWAEDMGKQPRRFLFRGFIVDGDVVFAGGPIQLQRALLIAALEAKGSGTLTHPSLGILKVSVVRFSIGQALSARSMSSVDLEFVESGKQQFPSLLSSSSGIFSAANLCKVALVVDGIRAIALAAGAGGTRKDLSVAASAWSTKVADLGTDATALHQLTAQLPGSYGRFSPGANAGLTGQRATVYTTTTTVADLTQVASSARAAIVAAAAALASAATDAKLAYAGAVADAATALVQALADACADPADAIRLLVDLISFVPTRTEARRAIGMALGGMLQRAAAAAITLAVADYQPASADDAAAMISKVGDVLDIIATAAADAGDDQSYRALAAARGAIVADLRARGATRARIMTFRTGRSLPAIVLAQRWYRDSSRADQIVTQAPASPSPLFMPTAMKALAS